MAKSEIIPDIKIPKTIEVIHDELVKRRQQYEKICKQFAPDSPVKIGDEVIVSASPDSRIRATIRSVSYHPHDANCWHGWKIFAFAPEYGRAFYVKSTHKIFNI